MNSKKDEGKQRNTKSRFRLRELVYHNTFVFVCSLITAVVGWFVMAAGSDRNGSYVVQNVPVNISLSARAEEEGLRVFNASYDTVDIEVSGSSSITRALTAEDFEVSVTLNPTSTKLTGNTTQKLSAQVKCVKRNAVSDYDIVSVSPEEITLEYDRFKETALKIEPDLTYTAATGFYPGTPVLSVEQVKVSGPESAVNKAVRAAVSYNAADPLREFGEWHCPLRLFDQDSQELADLESLYLTTDVEEVQVTVPVTPKKTVPLQVTTAHAPSSFSSSRITISPEAIELTGSAETLGTVTEIRLDTIIDFAELDLDQRSASYTMEIPVPAGTKDITNPGSNTLSQATVTVNLNGYRTNTVTVPESNVQLLNAPTGSLEAQLSSRSLEVVLAGPEAQVSKLTGDSVTVQVDMSNMEVRAGMMEAPATVAISGSAGEACWVLGAYTVTLAIQDVRTQSVSSQMGSEAALAAAPPAA